MGIVQVEQGDTVQVEQVDTVQAEQVDTVQVDSLAAGRVALQGKPVQLSADSRKLQRRGTDKLPADSHSPAADTLAAVGLDRPEAGLRSTRAAGCLSLQGQAGLEILPRGLCPRFSPYTSAVRHELLSGQ